MYEHKLDPFFEREKNKYQFPVPSREYILEVLTKYSGALDVTQVVKAFDLLNPNNAGENHIILQAVSNRLNAMVRDGQIMTDVAGKYKTIVEKDVLEGEVLTTKKNVWVKVINDDLVTSTDEKPQNFASENLTTDLYRLAFSEQKKVMDEDKVQFVVDYAKSISIEDGYFYAKIVKIVKHAHHVLLGKIIKCKNHYKDNDSVFKFVANNLKLKHEFLVTNPSLVKGGEMVRFIIATHPWAKEKISGEVIEVLGAYYSSSVRMQSIVEEYEIRNNWNEDIEREIELLDNELVVNKIKDKQQRKDLRHYDFITIDGADAKDFDDAVYCKDTNNGWRLIVAIADVDYYVKLGTAIDHEAQLRGNSVYFPQDVIPMLPEKLSNNLCSLVPHQPRLCMVADMQFNNAGERIGSEFYQGVIESKARLTYDETQSYIDKIASKRTGAQKLQTNQHTNVIDLVFNLYKLYRKLVKKRVATGVLDFPSIESRFKYAEDNSIAEINLVPRLESHKLIEEAMLCANQAVATYLLQKSICAIYRNHEEPSGTKLQALKDFIKTSGITWQCSDKPNLKNFAALQKLTNKHHNKTVLNTIILRSMMTAEYSVENKGHFGLGYDQYLHFTSPIRRYADLVTHRVLKKSLGYKVQNYKPQSDLATHLSDTEHKADDATRKFEKFLKCQFMTNHIGQSFSGTIVTVLGFGIFVQIDKLYIEGLVHATDLNDDYYVYHAEKQMLQGRRTNKVYKLGDVVQVVVCNVNMDELRIQLVLSKNNTSTSKTERVKRSKLVKKKTKKKIKTQENIKVTKKKQVQTKTSMQTKNNLKNKVKTIKKT